MTANAYDTIIADVQLSDGNSIKLYKQAHDTEETNYIFTSAFPEELPAQRALKIEEASFLEKPFTFNKLTELLTPQYGKDMAIAV